MTLGLGKPRRVMIKLSIFFGWLDLNLMLMQHWSTFVPMPRLRMVHQIAVRTQLQCWMGFFFFFFGKNIVSILKVYMKISFCYLTIKRSFLSLNY